VTRNFANKRYFVSHLEPHDRPEPDRLYQIQILDSSGRAEAWGYVGESETELVVESHVVPAPVLTAARRQVLGKGDYVDDDGNPIRPF